MKSLGSILAPPLICVGLLAGVMAEKSSQVKPEHADAYHARVRAAVTAIDHKIGLWTGKDVAEQIAAVKLLKPNVMLNRQYSNNAAPARGHYRQYANLLLVQCRDTRDMVGHYPENCYISSGQVLESKRPRDWKLRDPETGREMTVGGMEYVFTSTSREGVARHCVYHFLVVPGTGIVRDMAGVNRAAEDYQARYFGAAQCQVVMSADHYDEAERDEMFQALLGPNVEVLEALVNVDVP